MGRLIIISAALSAALAGPVRAEGTIWEFLFGAPELRAMEDAASARPERPKIWTLHPSDRSRHPDADYHIGYGFGRGYDGDNSRPFPFIGRTFSYDGGASRGRSYGYTTPNGAFIQQGRPQLSRGVKRSTTSRRINQAFR